MTPAGQPASLLQAATLILLRQHDGEIQTYLLRRSPTSRFMPGLFVFPGGLVDGADCDEAFWKDRVDLSPGAVGERLGRGLGFAEVSRYAVAAIRETFEEAGVLFASKTDATAADLKGAGERRLQGSRQRGWFRNLVQDQAWTLAFSALAPWAQWITPVGMSHRFDTRFFVAALPEGQDGRPDMRETTEGRWISAKQALKDNIAGRIPLSPPTLVTLQELRGYAALDGLQQGIRGRGWGEPIFPRLVSLGENMGSVIIEPWDPFYRREEIRVEARKLPASVLPAGEPFSRLWNDGGVWKPVSST
jgi:8-oxo-dGTP pyrophosphatase MutT (NUDIX family)